MGKRKGQRLDLRPGCSHSMAAGWTHWRPIVATLHNPVWRWGLWGSAGERFVWSGQSSSILPISHQATVDPPGPRPARPPVAPCPTLAYLWSMQVRKAPNPLVSLAVQSPIGHGRGKLDTAGPQAPPRSPRGPPRGGPWAPQGMRNPFTFLGQNPHPSSTPAPIHIFGPK
jgi:hypothetical protein